MKLGIILGLVLATFFSSVFKSPKAPTYGPIYSGATTFTVLHSVSTPLTWTKTGELSFPKYQNDSNVVFTCQITFQNELPGPYGTMFKLKFMTAAGEYFAESPFTGQLCQGAYSYHNAMLSDTIYDPRSEEHPPAGEYVAELWAYTGGGTLNIVPFGTNIAVFECPFFITPE